MTRMGRLPAGTGAEAKVEGLTVLLKLSKFHQITYNQFWMRLEVLPRADGSRSKANLRSEMNPTISLGPIGCGSDTILLEGLDIQSVIKFHTEQHNLGRPRFFPTCGLALLLTSSEQ
mmetsp:Transcript_42996/g.67006  ORF Transcript_42996/g.67006 Transcript_42996/m.67006 type:complete len:117 (+) Transcript_42996:1539-1889(+)